MPADLTGITDLAEWPPFVRQVRAAMIQAAVAVASELADATPRSTLRRALSTNVFTDLDGYTARFAIAVASDAAITNASTDGQISFTVDAMWDAIAGAPPAASS